MNTEISSYVPKSMNVLPEGSGPGQLNSFAIILEHKIPTIFKQFRIGTLPENDTINDLDFISFLLTLLFIPSEI